jgi:hypothetical protein
VQSAGSAESPPSFFAASSRFVGTAAESRGLLLHAVSKPTAAIHPAERLDPEWLTALLQLQWVVAHAEFAPEPEKLQIIHVFLVTSIKPQRCIQQRKLPA